jgi:hypothetical protein
MATDDLINEDIFFSQNQFHMDTSRRAYLPFDDMMIDNVR